MKFSFTDQREVKKFFVIFYAVGIIGMLIPQTFSIFKILIPYSLLLSFGYLLYFDGNRKNKMAYAIFLLIFLIGFLVEMVGVNTGLIFGYYTYEMGLGYKIYNTPIIIGLNWLFLVYVTSSILEKYRIHKVVKIIVASLLMIVYDLILEQAAPKMDMWHWEKNTIPLQNYGVWFLLALFFHGLIIIFKINTKNPLSLVLFIAQFIFLSFLAFWLP